MKILFTCIACLFELHVKQCCRILAIEILRTFEGSSQIAVGANVAVKSFIVSYRSCDNASICLWV